MSWTEQDRAFMELALRLARRGAGRVLPNPLVGAVVVKDGRIVGTGYHRRFGGPHAEVEALNASGEAARGATLYVSLEPCCHYGKTPPCTERILQAGVARVVAAMLDPNPAVNGKGVAQLRDHGVKVDVGVCESQARELNAPFITFVTQKRPFVTVKYAATLDGRIADSDKQARWISSEAARRQVHRWRRDAGAVLVGIGTVLADDPLLTVRLVKGPQPWRIVLDSQLRIPLQARLVNDAHVKRTVLVCCAGADHEGKRATLARRGVHIVEVACQNGRIPMQEALSQLAGMNIAHVFVEGGSGIISSLFQLHLVDKLAVFVAPKLFGAGLPPLELKGFGAKRPITFQDARWKRVGPDVLFEGKPVWSD